MLPEQQKNMLLAITVSLVIVIGFNVLFPPAKPPADKQEAQKTEQSAQPQQAPLSGQNAAGQKPAPQPTGKEAGQAAGQPAKKADDGPKLGADVSAVQPKAQAPASQQGALSREAALAAGPRVEISTHRLTGSISLTGARIDELVLREFREKLDPNSPQIELLQPTGTAHPYYAEFGWLGNGVKTPTATTVWTANRSTLGPGDTVTLSWNNGEGLTFERDIGLDDDYMFTITQRVRNTSNKSLSLAPYGLVSRTGTPEVLGFYILHEGLVGVLNGALREVDYDDFEESGPKRFDSTGGWLGITDKYWLAALVPDQSKKIKSSFVSHQRGAQPAYQADYLYDPLTVNPGGTIEAKSHFFAGAKEKRVLDRYMDDLKIEKFDLAIDFGWFWFFTKPFAEALTYFHGLLGNYGLAILLLTVIIKLIFFPLANKSYRAMSKMKALQPKMEELKERFGEDRQRMNTELMNLYKAEKVNPAAGCFPIVIQIPVFFALYKVLFVSIEMRHAPFFGWIHDLSAPDPLGLLTAFGLIQWDVPSSIAFLNIGIWPIIMGGTMFLQQKLNPTPADPIQAKIFLFMPLIFTFILAPFPAGLVIYWAWNNILSIAQQWVIMKRMGVKIS
jgi:YidC/Oxa1 family membrane protein insertase